MKEAEFLQSTVEKAFNMAKETGEVCKADPAYEPMYNTAQLPVPNENPSITIKQVDPININQLGSVHVSIINCGHECTTFIHDFKRPLSLEFVIKKI